MILFKKQKAIALERDTAANDHLIDFHVLCVLHSRSGREIQPITYRVKCQKVHQSFNCSFLLLGLLVRVKLFEIIFFPSKSCRLTTGAPDTPIQSS